MTKNNKPVIADGMFDGDKPYQVRARIALPLLVRQAIAQEQVCYGPLSREIGMPNPRNMNYVLGSVGTTIDQLSRTWKAPIPPIQSLAVGKDSGLPGKGFFEGFTGLVSPTRQQRQAILNEYHAKIFAYPHWLKVLAALQLKPTEAQASEAVEQARHMRGGGESDAHRRLKDRIYHQPSLVGAPSQPTLREKEFPLPSGDKVDVYFERGRSQYAIEVKSSISGIDDVARGLFQCVKYEATLVKWRAWQSSQVDIRVVLALGGALPLSLLGLKNALRVEVVEHLE